jgi:hypothetical protein
MNSKLNFLIGIIAFFCTSIYSDAKSNIYGGIEIGSKGIKMSVLEVGNIKKGDYTVKSFWTENIGIIKGLQKTVIS